MALLLATRSLFNAAVVSISTSTDAAHYMYHFKCIELIQTPLQARGDTIYEWLQQFAHMHSGRGVVR
ncbi:hypothetical protein PC114_g16397 [Phytophthora cactorum]|nr:hypothetical protein PC112_g15312 [Phytophthora cactorum]KAG2893023.1 hypothetical protein PC114_g16397 [Phytophthora cactorum]KAG3102700.1 hypothetical protein PI125_g14083 [Phytophthora idaei]KAG3146546.1 hypothetical protein PI126_g13286 [Phytophthora idaei]KAG4048891.1 hypothetical protein PC123_g15813 [Phytophthora cactorum]